jgi:hypothetical protein
MRHAVQGSQTSGTDARPAQTEPAQFRQAFQSCHAGIGDVIPPQVKAREMRELAEGNQSRIGDRSVTKLKFAYRFGALHMSDAAIINWTSGKTNDLQIREIGQCVKAVAMDGGPSERENMQPAKRLEVGQPGIGDSPAFEANGGE